MTDFNAIEEGLLDALDFARGEQTDSGIHRLEVPLVNVKEIREMLGMSQTEFARAFGVTVSTVRNWEQGRRVPRGPARMLLNIIDQEPDAVARVLDRLVA